MQDKIETNKQFVNYCIRICLRARRMFRGQKPSTFYMQIVHANEHKPELFALKNDMEKHWEFWGLRFQSWAHGILGDVFDVKHFISQRRLLDIGRVAC